MKNLELINSFLVMCDFMNFSKAADALFLTQPALSRQISTLEKELNTKLFIRDHRSISLTEDGKILRDEFKVIYHLYKQALKGIESRKNELTGDFNIGILSGMLIGDFLPFITTQFQSLYPKVNISLKTYSFKNLIHHLCLGELDVIFTLLFEIEEHSEIDYRIIEETKDYIVVNSIHRLSKENEVNIEDLKDETWIIVSKDDSIKSPNLILEKCHALGYIPKVKYVPTLREVMLMVESGAGICVLDGRNALKLNPNVKFLEVDQISKPYLTMAWHSKDQNPLRKHFSNLMTTHHMFLDQHRGEKAPCFQNKQFA